MDEAEQRELGMAMEKTVAAGETITIPDTHEVYCLRAPITTGALVKATHINGGAPVGTFTCDTHLSTTGLTGGSAVDVRGEMLLNLSSVTCDAGSPASVVCLIRTRA